MATLIKSDLEFILEQIRIAEAHAAGADLASLLPSPYAMLGLRTVDGTLNNLVAGQSTFGAADQTFPRLLDPFFQPAENGTTYAQFNGLVQDSQPRTISNLIVDQTASNPAAVEANGGAQAAISPGLDGIFGTADDKEVYFIPNTSPDEGLSAGFNSWFTLFGQFFDHGLDLVNKGGSGTVRIALQPDDPLYVPGGPNFMILTRATNGAGPDNIVGTADDVREHNNQTTPFVDQNQTYTSHASHQVFLRDYAVRDIPGDTLGPRPVATGLLLDGSAGGLATWADVKANALKLGIKLSDTDIYNVPLLRTDQYGNFIPGPNGFAQVVVMQSAGVDGIAGTDDDVNIFVEGIAGGIDINNAGVMGGTTVRTNHAFLDDLAHNASPGTRTADTDTDVGAPDAVLTPGTYDNELLDAHFITGDGRGNENIGLTAVHHVFHSEHNRQVDAIKQTVLASADPAFIQQWQFADGSWNGERLFQAAKFATEMQYQHLVFEEFARKVQPNIDGFLMYDADLNPAIVAEFAHVVYRFGHSMLTETVDRFDSNFNVIGNPNGADPADQQMGLIAAFLNPIAFTQNGTLNAEQAAGAIVRGMTRQAGNEIDEFITEALRNNLVGLPLDLAAINIARGRDAGVPSLNAARRDFFTHTGDTQLKPYESWTDLANNLKHAASVINFIAAYGTHGALTAADVNTLAEKRAVATALVMGGSALINAGTPEARVFTAADADRLDFLNSTGIYAHAPGQATTTGVDAIDFWIGGLAEKQMPFGGLLGSTFNFVFETQLEALQNHDRFYYLGRLAGLNFLTEMENNSFAKLIMANSDATHLPADVFSNPALILEVNQNRQFNDVDGDGVLDQGVDPVGGSVLIPLVIRDNPDTAGPDTNYLRYTGADHVVLGGTEGNDILIASEGDDTIWGDGGNDRIEGGDGNDMIEGGAGHDIITDKGGDDNIKGGAGNDVIHGGNGLNLLIGGEGKDFIITGEDISDTFGGQGDDFIYGAKTNLPSLGNEGNDWIEIGTQDGAPGDNFDLLNRDLVRGHDVFVGGGGFDEMLGEGGDDIFVGSEGEDHADGSSGFDWATYKNDAQGVTVDLQVNDFIEPPTTPSNAGILDRFAFVEGLSGSSKADILRGDDQEAADFATAGAQGSVLQEDGIALVTGLQALLGTGVTSFGRGNIILGGSGSDIIEGRAGDDIIDGDKWLNVRISVRAGIDAEGNAIGAEIATTGGMNAPVSSADPLLNGKTLIQLMLQGTLNPGQLVIQREILDGTDDFDTAVFSAPLFDPTTGAANYAITTSADGITTVADLRVVGPGVAVTDGTDTLTGIERLQFADQAVLLPGTAGLNAAPTGLLTISDDTPSVGQLVTVNRAANGLPVGIADGDGFAPGSFNYLWQVERDPGTGVFTDIIQDIGGNPSLAHGPSFRMTADLEGLSIRVRATYKDGSGTLEQVFSAATAAVGPGVAPAPAPLPPQETATESPGNGVHFIRSDLQFILSQIKIAEAHSAGANLADLLPNTRVAFGLRTVDGSFNNLVAGQEHFGAADQTFPLLLDQVFRNEGDDAFFGVTNNNYAVVGNVADADPRIISNLISDQTANNPAAVAANGGAAPVMSPGLDGVFGTTDDRPVFLIENATPDAALSAQFNSWFTFFGQFFDHGLDLVNKGGAGTIFIPLGADDPLVAGADGVFGNSDDLSPSARFMVVSRASNISVTAGADGQFNTADDVHLHNNQTTPFIDQNQTYTSNPSHQVFLREYVLVGGRPVDTGRLLEHEGGGLATWADIKEQARTVLGINLTDADLHNVPGLITDPYGNFVPGANGFPQLATLTGAVEGDPSANGGNGVTIPANAGRTGHAFLDDIAHFANPRGSSGAMLTEDSDAIAGNAVAPGQYDGELLDRHYITGDGRGNENIGLTSVHFVFHAEHNRLVEHIKDVVLASNDLAFVNEWLAVPLANLPANQAEIDAMVWDGQRVFQAARFGTEMQYQHLVFEEFARKVQPQVDLFFAPTQVYDTQLNPAITAEFAHVVYRFGHSMLTETIDRYDTTFQSDQIGLIAAFLNPMEFAVNGSAMEGASNIIRGVTREAGNEIDEFVTEALRNNLVGLPLDLPAINIARGRDAGVPSLNQARAEFYAATGDSQLTPYKSWADFGGNLKHFESLVNFIAAYGTHALITAETTTAGKRAAAYAIVYGEGGLDGDVATLGDNPTNVPSDRMEFLNATGAYAGGNLGGLNDVDFWIGGLAEKQMPFGGLLGSTFNFVFENQLESLQDGDRFYYLERTQGLNFLTELENNSFAKLIMANTNVTHLPGDVFSTPAYTLEVDETKQFTGLGPTGRDDPTDGGIPLVIRNNPLTDTPDPGYLQYVGEDHVVLGGTSGNDTLISSIGDDTLYGDGGNDRLEGGDGVDMLLGGDGDDIITDKGGDDNIQGQNGNDAIHGGNGINLILGGFGKDFIVTGEDASESFGGVGDDMILGVRANEFVFGNEGDDWIEVGMVDGAAGDNFDAFGQDLVRGNDVFIGEGLTDRMDGEGGDDIMLGNGGEGDRYEGFSGFDWAVFRDAPAGATVDLTLRAFDETPLPPNEATLARFTSVEGLSGSSHNDFLRGDNNTATEIAVSGAYGSVLENIALISGLQSFLNDMTPGTNVVTSFGAGNIILGGDGSDIIEGRGGDDLIDGDLYLSVRLAGLDNNGQAFSAFSMHELQARVFAGEINPGNINIVREILDSNSSDFDTALYSGALFDADGDAQYAIAINGVDVFDAAVRNTDPNPTITLTAEQRAAIAAGGVVTVTALNGLDGTDQLRNIERLQFSDQSIILDGSNSGPVGQLQISDTTPGEDQGLTVGDITLIGSGVTDPDNPNAGRITGPVTYYWQQEVREGVFEDIFVLNEAPEGARATGLTFTPGDEQVGLRLRVRAVYRDANGALETAYSAPTAAVAGVNDAPVGTVSISDTTPTETEALVALAQFTDPDGMTTSVLSYQWFQSGIGGAGPFTAIAGATQAQFTPGQAQVNRALQVTVTYVDDQGFTNTVTSAPTVVTGDQFAPSGLGQALVGNEGQDLVFGGGGSDLISTGGGIDRIDGGTGSDNISAGADDDRITGGAGGDIINAGAGDDQIFYAMGDGADLVDGDTGSDTLRIAGTAGNDTLDILLNGTASVGVEGGTVLNVETMAADLGAGTDTLNYGTTSIGVTVDLGAGTATGFAAAAAVAGQGTIAALPGMAAIANIENVVGGAAADTIDGSASANTLSGGNGADLLSGAGGADTVNGDAGSDTIFATVDDGSDIYNGGAGTDTYDLSRTAAGATITAGLGGFTSATSAQTGTDTLTSIERLIGSTGTDRLVVSAGLGNQTLNLSFDGSRITQFQTFAIEGIEQVEVNLGGSAGDALNFSASTAGVTVDLGAGTGSGGLANLAGIENITGSALADLLAGAAGVNNALTGGAGNDVYVVHDAGDTVNETNGTANGTDEVRSFVSYTITDADVENLTLLGSANLNGTGNGSANVITGNDGNNTLSGLGGADTIIGGGGDDIINGGAGNDILRGMLGNDRFVFGATNESGVGTNNNDVIEDFATGDLLDVSGIDANTNGLAIGNQAFQFIGTSGFTAVGQLRVTQSGSDTIVQLNTNNGTGTIEMEIKLLNVNAASLTQNDFVL